MWPEYGVFSDRDARNVIGYFHVNDSGSSSSTHHDARQMQGVSDSTQTQSQKVASWFGDGALSGSRAAASDEIESVGASMALRIHTCET